MLLWNWFLTEILLYQTIAGNVRELVYQTVAFLQITEQQVHTWSMDVNQFVADEDEGSYSCRISGKRSLTLLKSNSYA
jgi:hypothetical protein